MGTLTRGPGGVGFDINCGVRLLRTNLFESDLKECKEALAQSLFDHIPVGVGSKGVIPTSSKDLDAALEMGMDWSLREGYAWAEDKEHVEEYGRMLQADPRKVRERGCSGLFLFHFAAFFLHRPAMAPICAGLPPCQEEGAAPARHPGCRQPLLRDTGR